MFDSKTINFLQEAIHQIVNEYEYLVLKPLKTLDKLTTNGRYIDYAYVEKVSIEEIESSKISGIMTGRVEVIEQHFPDVNTEEYIEDDYVELYPFEIPFIVDISDLNKLPSNIYEIWLNCHSIEENEFFVKLKEIIQTELIFYKPTVYT